jgi:hypothetical protein
MTELREMRDLGGNEVVNMVASHLRRRRQLVLSGMPCSARRPATLPPARMPTALMESPDTIAADR